MEVNGKKHKGKGGKPARMDPRSLPDTVWFNPKPSSEDVTFLDGKEAEYVEFVVTLVDRLAEGERLSVRFDSHSGRWLAILFIDPSTEGKGVQALSVRGESAFDACVLLYYFNYVKFADGWIKDASLPTGRFG